MKHTLMLAVVPLFLASFVISAHASSCGSCTTTTTTTVTKTVKKGCCYAKKKPKKKTYHRVVSSCGYPPCYDYSRYESWYDNQCPGGAYNCYFDTEGNNFQQDYYPINYGHELQFQCLDDAENPASCSQG